MATNLRLRPETETALRAEAERSNRSQQDLIREAVDQYLGLRAVEATSPVDPLVASGQVTPPRTPFRQAERLLQLPPCVTSIDLLDGDDRLI